MTDTAQIIHDAEEALELLAADDEALAAYIAAHELYVAAKQATNAAMREELDAIIAEASNGGPPVDPPIDPPPAALPQASLLDANDTPPGGTMMFKLTLDKPLANVGSITLVIEGAEPIQVPLEAGVTYLDIPVAIPANATPGIWTATISRANPTEIEILDGEAIGKVVVAPPSNGDLPASGTDVAAPILFPAGSWRELRTFAAKVKLDSAPSTHVKVAGGDSTKNAFGGWVLERHGGGQMQAWVYVDGKPQTARSTAQLLPIGTSVFVAVRIFPDKIMLTMGAQTFTKIFTGTVDAFDGPSVVGDGYWKHELAGAWPGEIIEWHADTTPFSDAALAVLATEWQ